MIFTKKIMLVVLGTLAAPLWASHRHHHGTHHHQGGEQAAGHPPSVPPGNTTVTTGGNGTTATSGGSAGTGAPAQGAAFFQSGVYPFPTLGIDHDRNRSIIYLGSDDTAEQDFNSQLTIHTGPFCVVEEGFFSGNVGLLLSPFALTGGGYLGIGLGISGRKNFESWRFASSFAAARAMPRLKHFPRTAEELLSLPNGSIIISRLSGAVVVPLRAIVGYVAAAGPEVGITGEWTVKIAKFNNYSVVVSLSSIKEKFVGATASLAFSFIRSAKSKAQGRLYSYEISLEEETGREAYNQIFKGNLAAVEKRVRVINENDEIAKVFKDLSWGKMHSHQHTRVAAFGLPFLASRVYNRGSLEMTKEKFTFITAQDNTPLGSVPAGTRLRSVRGGYYEAKINQGRLTRHKKQHKQFTVHLDEVKFPADRNPDEQLDPIPSRRLLGHFDYSVKKNRWFPGDWQKEIFKLAKHIGFRDQLSAPMQIADDKEEIEYAELAAHFTLSEASIAALAQTVAREGAEGFRARLDRESGEKISGWFANPQYQTREICNFEAGCKGRVQRKTKEGITEAVARLVQLSTFSSQRAEDAPLDKKAYVRLVVEFGRYFTRNQFTIGAFLPELLSNRLSNPVNDFALCVQWSGSRFRRQQLVLIPSQLRRDRNKCFLQDETSIDMVPEKPDRFRFIP